MKHLCCNKILVIFVLLASFLQASVHDKSAIVYYGYDISYPMVGIHDYIIIQPEHIDTSTHAFSVYKNKIYAYVSIGELDKSFKNDKNINRSWILASNTLWNSKVMDITNPDYQNFLFQELIEPRMKQGFQNFFFDTLDSYKIAAKTLIQKRRSKEALIAFINRFHEKYPDAKLILNRGFDILDDVHDSIQAVLFESYYKGLGGKDLEYTDISNNDRKWLDQYIKKIKSYKLDTIAVDYLPFEKLDQSGEIIDKIKKKGMIPYISNKELNIYGRSSKNPLKREILTLIDEEKHDRIEQSAHQYGALPLEYMGYIQKLRNIDKKGLPSLEQMQRYAGIVVWLSDFYAKPQKLINWAASLQNIGIKVVFIDDFGVNLSKNILKPLGIDVPNIYNTSQQLNKIVIQDKMMGFEIEPVKNIDLYLQPHDAKALLSLEDSNKNSTTLAAITPWGGYAVAKSFITEINGDNLFVINPFLFFAKALDLQPLIVPDTTTENGKRLLFSHVDGDGIMNRVEWNPSLFSGETLYSDIFSHYKIPQSVSIIGAEIEPDGLYPDLSKKLSFVAKKIYSLENIEGATHTFTHPFIWGKIINGDLDEKYRLKVKGYHFSLDKEIPGTLAYINSLMPKYKQKAHTVFWSGDCIPPEWVLQYTYKHHILNINGGDTLITNSAPWQSLIAPLGLERNGYYQIFTGAQNENVYTHNWLGPFWGFKKVVQTFKLTNSPRRFKPIDIYYHLYSGSKRASLNALKYVFDWATAQEVFPLYTSQYIKKAMDYYSVSIAKEKNDWLFAGMQNLRTLRKENGNASADLTSSQGIVGMKHFENHTYFHCDNSDTHILHMTKKSYTKPYLIDANGKLEKSEIFAKKATFAFKGEVGLKLKLFVPQQCRLESTPKVRIQRFKNNVVSLDYKNKKEALVHVICR